jgi:hypothetical protein
MKSLKRKIIEFQVQAPQNQLDFKMKAIIIMIKMLIHLYQVY